MSIPLKKREKPEWADPEKHRRLFAEDARSRRQHAVARLHALRLRKLDGDHPPSHEYDLATASVRCLPDGWTLNDMLMSATCEWPSERGLILGEDFSPLEAWMTRREGDGTEAPQK